jgi:hypothetical protein
LILIAIGSIFAAMDLSSFFGSQERTKGADLARKDLIVISSASDTDVRAFVKGSSPGRVTLTADSVAAPTLSTACTCPQSRNGSLCKHIWGVLLKLEETGADFLEGKVEIAAPSTVISPTEQNRQAKQEEYRNEQKQRLKARNKEIRLQKKLKEHGPRFAYPARVQESLAFFAAHDFALTDLDMASLINARKLLSRVFHPDKGGTHQEILQLNAHFKILEDYLRGV